MSYGVFGDALRIENNMRCELSYFRGDARPHLVSCNARAGAPSRRAASRPRAQWLAAEFASAQADAFADMGGGWDAEGGLDDDDTASEASWDDEAWNEPDA